MAARTPSGGTTPAVPGRGNTASTPPSPGWYPDPRHVAEQRYWDGEIWTDRVWAPPPPTPEAPPMPTPGKGAAIGSVLLAVVSCLWGVLSMLLLMAGVIAEQDAWDYGETTNSSMGGVLWFTGIGLLVPVSGMYLAVRSLHTQYSKTALTAVLLNGALLVAGIFSLVRAIDVFVLS